MTQKNNFVVIRLQLKKIKQKKTTPPFIKILNSHIYYLHFYLIYKKLYFGSTNGSLGKVIIDCNVINEIFLFVVGGIGTRIQV